MRNTVGRYPFVDADDLSQSVHCYVPRIIDRYDPANSAGCSFSKYSYHRLAFCVKDVLRQRDDLGIRWPQKKHYPEWSHLEDIVDINGNNLAPQIEDHRGTEPLDHLVAIEERQTVAADLADLQAATVTPRNRMPGYTSEKRRLAAAKCKATRAAKKAKAEREFAKAAEAKAVAKAKPGPKPGPKPKPVMPTVVDILHLRAAKQLVMACGSPDAARAAIDAYLSI